MTRTTRTGLRLAYSGRVSRSTRSVGISAVIRCVTSSRRANVAPKPQLHFELLASTKLLTEVATLAALVATAAIWEADGLDGSAFSALENWLTEVWRALVWLGKSLFALL